MKKKILLSLFIFIALFTITGCGSKNKENSNETGNKKQVERESFKKQQGY
jgi:predicted small lipoprotein YifL